MNQGTRAVTSAWLGHSTQIVKLALAAAAASALGNVLLYAAARGLSLDLAVTDGPGSRLAVPLSLADVIVASTVPAAPAALLWTTLKSRARHPRRLFVGSACTVFIATLIPVAMLPTGVVTQCVLAAMHLVSAAAIATTLLRSSP